MKNTAIFTILFLMGYTASVMAQDINFYWPMKYNKNPGVKYDTEVKVSEKQSISITGDGSIVQIISPVALEENTDYELVLYMKGEKLGGDKPGNGAKVLLNGNNKWMGLASSGKGIDTGDFDWRKLKAKFNTKYFQTGKINIALRVIGNGKCYFDKVSINKIEK